MFCKNCGRVIDKKASQCINCGYRVSQNDQQTTYRDTYTTDYSEPQTSQLYTVNTVFHLPTGRIARGISLLITVVIMSTVGFTILSAFLNF